jgi:hypothetical protein
MEAQENKVTACTLPPPGWTCKLADGHDGPCPAIPTPPPPPPPTRIVKDGIEIPQLQLIAKKASAIPDHVAVYLILILMVAGAWMFGTLHGQDEMKAHYAQVIKYMGVQHDKALAQQTEESNKANADLHEKLMKAQNQKAQTRTIIKEVKTYVTQKSDAACTIPVGFVWMYDQSLAPEAAGMAGGRPADVEAPSGVALSAVAETAASNNAECVERGAVIQSWQEWYVRNKDIYERAAKLMNKAVDGIK